MGWQTYYPSLALRNRGNTLSTPEKVVGYNNTPGGIGAVQKR